MLGSCNRYATLSKLGEGAFGTVHKARRPGRQKARLRPRLTTRPSCGVQAIDGFTGGKVAIKRVYLRKLNEGVHA